MGSLTPSNKICAIFETQGRMSLASFYAVTKRLGKHSDHRALISTGHATGVLWPIEHKYKGPPFWWSFGEAGLITVIQEDEWIYTALDRAY